MVHPLGSKETTSISGVSPPWFFFASGLHRCRMAMRTGTVSRESLNPRIKGLKERPSKGPLGFYRGFMRLYMVHI